MKQYREEMTNRDADWLCFMADIESGWDELEPHQIISRDFMTGCADEHQEAA